MGGREAAHSSKTAQMLAKARSNVLRSKKALSRTMTTRSMATKPDMSMSMSMSTEPMVIEDDVMMLLLVDVDAVAAKEEAKNNDNNINAGDNNNDDNKPAEEEQPQPQPAVVSEVQVVEGEEKKGDGEAALLSLDDWPMIWTYEEEHIWFRKAYEYGWYPTPTPTPESMNTTSTSGEYWMPRVDHSNETVWNDDDLSTWLPFQDNN